MVSEAIKHVEPKHTGISLQKLLLKPNPIDKDSEAG